MHVQPESEISISELRPETDNNMVQSAKSLKNHKQKMIGTSAGKKKEIEESAIFGNVDQGHEGIYTDSVIASDAEKMALEIKEQIKRGSSMKEALIKAIRKGSKFVDKGGLARGKNKKATGDVTQENIVESNRRKRKVMKFDRIRPVDKITDQVSSKDKEQKSSSKSGVTKSSSSKSGETKSVSRKGKGKSVAQVGDLISVKSELFDGIDVTICEPPVVQPSSFNVFKLGLHQ
jgi:hypothetical protein